MEAGGGGGEMRPVCWRVSAEFTGGGLVQAGQWGRVRSPRSVSSGSRARTARQWTPATVSQWWQTDTSDQPSSVAHQCPLVTCWWVPQHWTRGTWHVAQHLAHNTVITRSGHRGQPSWQHHTRHVSRGRANICGNMKHINFDSKSKRGQMTEVTYLTAPPLSDVMSLTPESWSRCP